MVAIKNAWHTLHNKLLVVSLLYIYRVNCYIAHGWDQYLVDPDRGANCQKKLALIASRKPQSLSVQLLQALPPSSDSQWTNQLHKLPKVTTVLFTAF